MTTITKERIELFIKNPLDNGLTRGEQMEVARIALASLAAEPVAVNDDMAYAFHHALSDSSLGADEVEEIKAGLRAAFANVTIQPEPVVPDEIEPDDSNTFDYVDGWNACRAAMLYGAVPASQAYKLPQTQFKQVADLYEMQFDDGRTCAFHTDAQKAVQWLQACDGNRVQEYIKLERLQNALSGNSPVTPDGWVMVPKRLTAENGAKGALSGEFSETTFISCLECFGDDDCDTCDGSGRIEIKVPVTWSTIKSIWDKGIEYFAAKPSQEVK
ncbi:hypothetical protein E6D06_01365 [Escherichia coli]|nr:hypothetical protein [Escherichia coli]HAE7898256.1 hypothetical protein [Salmonella enterica subsp. enterica serovar Typhimurium]EHU9077248.1 hypothetical protein [Escherichia coli]EIA1387549.1 hypothetical protein [Escherichia coli]EKP7851935.1 hypothetical protein [Escherichia coli]